MIDEFNESHKWWARFSDDKTMRYRLARSLMIGDFKLAVASDDVPRWPGRVACVDNPYDGREFGERVVFVLTNPSDADAFDDDPTVYECGIRVSAIGCDLYEVVNLYPVRSPYPIDVKRWRDRTSLHERISVYAENDEQIIAACRDAKMVIPGWGNHGELDMRGEQVEWLLRRNGIQLHTLGFTKSGAPIHPLARGKHRIPRNRKPELWAR